MASRPTKLLGVVRKAAVLIVGVGVLLAGVLMLVLPGPGWVAIFAALTLLGREFAWARRAHQWLRARLGKVYRRVRRNVGVRDRRAEAEPDPASVAPGEATAHLD